MKSTYGLEVYNVFDITYPPFIYTTTAAISAAQLITGFIADVRLCNSSNSPQAANVQ